MIREESQEPAAASDPAASPVSLLIFDHDVIDGLHFRGGPEEGAAEEGSVLLADDAVAILLGPLMQERAGAAEVPEEGHQADRYERQDQEGRTEVHRCLRGRGELQRTQAG